MKKKTFMFNSSGGAGNALTRVLHSYADAAFPKGGSDCASASREALLVIIDKLQGEPYCEISKRQRPILKAAVRWYYQESGIKSTSDADTDEFKMLESLLQK